MKSFLCLLMSSEVHCTILTVQTDVSLRYNPPKKTKYNTVSETTQMWQYLEIVFVGSDEFTY